MSEFYRFRSIASLLNKHKELKKQTVYFAGPEELNDPMEAYRNVFWNGDKIVWTNLFRHYASYLNQYLLKYRILGKSVKLKLDSSPITVTLAQPQNLLEKDIFDDVWNNFLNVKNIKEILGALSNTKQRIYFKEIGYYLLCIHSILLDVIQKAHITHQLVSESEISRDKSDLPSIDWFTEKILQVIQNTDENEFEKINNALSFFQQYNDNQILKQKYAAYKLFKGISNIDTTLIQNTLTLLDFTRIYLENLINLPFPKWWTACFMENFDNLTTWANYADDHKGVCLIFDEKIIWEDKKFWTTALRKVNYENKPTEIDFFCSIGSGTVAEIMETWYTDDDGKISECANHIGYKSEEKHWREEYWNKFLRYITTKNRDWKYEKERRIILYANTKGLDNKDERTLTYDFNSLKGIIFGMRTSFETKMKVIEIIEDKCNEHKRIDFKFFQAFYSAEHDEIRKNPIESPFSIDDS